MPVSCVGGARWMPVPNMSTSTSQSGAQSRGSMTSSSISSATPTSTSASSAPSNSHSAGPMPAGVVFPGMPPMGVPPMPMPPGTTPADLLPVDPCLPCHSRHFLNRRSELAAGQAAGAEQVTVSAFSVSYSLCLMHDLV